MVNKVNETALVTIENNTAFTTSRGVAERFGKTHKHVLEAIRNNDCSDNFRESNFRPSSYVSLQNKTLSCFEITRDGFAVLAMGFNGKKAMHWKEQYITAFNAMEDKIINESKSIIDSSVAPTLRDLNALVSLMESGKATASDAGKVLSSYKKFKKNSQNEFKKIVNEVQYSLGFED